MSATTRTQSGPASVRTPRPRSAIRSSHSMGQGETARTQLWARQRHVDTITHGGLLRISFRSHRAPPRGDRVAGCWRSLTGRPAPSERPPTLSPWQRRVKPKTTNSPWSQQPYEQCVSTPSAYNFLHTSKPSLTGEPAMRKAAVTPKEPHVRAEPRSKRHASTIRSPLSNHSIEAFCLNPSCVNKVAYAVGQPGRKAMFCSQGCSTDYHTNRRRLRTEAERLDKALASLEPRTQEHKDLTERLKHVRWHLARYGG